MGRSNRRNDKKSGSSKSFGGFRSNFSSNTRSFSSGPREMHKAKCSECGKDCEVPFKPTEGKPVYCRDCFRQKKKW